jgi:hypothetical protein
MSRLPIVVATGYNRLFVFILYCVDIDIYEIDPMCYTREQKRTESYYVNDRFPCEKS